MGMKDRLIQALQGAQQLPPEALEQVPELARSHGGWVGELAKDAYGAVTLPGDVYRGGVDPTSDEFQKRLLDLAGMVTLGSTAAPRGALGSGAVLPAKKVGKALIGDNKGPPFPEYAERYPPVAEPTLEFDAKKGKEFLAKGESPETKAFMKERGRIMKDMQKNGFEPYFDPAQRFDVDPANYPSTHNTLTDNRPAKQVTRDAYDAQTVGDPEVLARLNTAYDHGQGLDMQNWYAMGQLEQEFIDELGEAAGRKAFRDRFAGAMAATTGGADPTSNFLSAMYGNFQRNKGLDTAIPSYEMPVPIGGRYISNNMKQYQKFADDDFNIPGDLNPKRYDFMHNYLGHKDKATIDEQMMGIIDPGNVYKGAPPNTAYGHFEEPVHIAARARGVDPREFQEVAWGGAKKDDKGNFAPVPMIQTVNESIERTHRLTGMPKKEIVRRGIVRGEIPMYGLSAVAIGKALQQDEDE